MSVIVPNGKFRQFGKNLPREKWVRKRMLSIGEEEGQKLYITARRVAKYAYLTTQNKAKPRNTWIEQSSSSSKTGDPWCS